MHSSEVAFQVYSDASGAPALVEVSHGRQSARFALDMLGGAAPACNLIGSGLSVRMTARAADVARRYYLDALRSRVSAEWLETNRAMYAGEA